MTIVVAYYCSDGMVVASDSMITSRIGIGTGVLPVSHQHGVKIYVIPGPQLFAYAGDPGQAARFKAFVEANHALILQQHGALDYTLQISANLHKQFQATGIGNAIDLNTVLGFIHGGACHCCVFEGAIQPRLLDKDHYCAALGSGRLSADPFLRFLSDTFCQGGQPTVREAVFLATWTAQHVIDVNPGGVAGPIHVAVVEKGQTGAYMARELPDTEIGEHQQAIESARDALRDWRKNIGGQSSEAAEGIPQPPAVPSPNGETPT
jgi:hypothetical protein